MALGNTSQAKRHGREVVGRRLPDFPGRSSGRQASPGRIPERLVDPGPFQLKRGEIRSRPRGLFRAPSYFAWGCFRDFVSALSRAPGCAVPALTASRFNSNHHALASPSAVARPHGHRNSRIPVSAGMEFALTRHRESIAEKMSR